MAVRGRALAVISVCRVTIKDTWQTLSFTVGAYGCVRQRLCRRVLLDLCRVFVVHGKLADSRSVGMQCVVNS